MKDLYYNIDDAEFVDQSGEKLSRFVPELFYQENAVWRIYLRDRDNRPRDLSGIVAWSAAVDRDYDAGTTPMCLTPSEKIAVDVPTGAVSVEIDAATAEFLAAVNGAPRRQAFFELCGFNSAGERELCLGFGISARMILAPDPAVSPETPDGLATKTYVSAVIGSAAESAYSAACAGVSGAIASGGFVNSSGARMIAGDAAASAASGAIYSGAEIDTQVGDYRITYTSGGGLAVSGSGASVVLSGGQIAADGANGESLRIASGGVYIDVVDENEEHQRLYVDGGGVSISGMGPGAGVNIHGGANGINCDTDSPDGFTVNGRPVATQLVTSVDSETTSAYIGVLSGGMSYVYTQPLTDLDIASVTSDCRAMFKFTAGSGFRLGLSGGAELVGLNSFDSGTRYVVAVGDGMVIVNSITIAGA